MAVGDRTAIRAAARAELADSGSLWSDAQLNRAIDEVTADITRLMPLEQFYEYTWRKTITDESFTSATAGTAKALANKPIKPESEVITNAAGTVTYTRDTDYSMDYVNGTITVLSGGSMLGATAYLADYERSPIAIDISISALSALLAPIRVELPGKSPPQEFTSFFTWANILWLTSQGVRTQEAIDDKDHVRVYYHAQHTAPADNANGTYPRFLDEVATKGVVAYALFVKSRQRNLQAVTDAASARTALGNIAALHTAIGTAATAMGTTYTDMETALDAVAALVTGASKSIMSELDLAVTEMVTANAQLDKADTTTTGPLDVAETTLGTISSALLALLGTALTAAIAKLTGSTDSVKEALDAAETVWAEEVKHILTTSNIPNIEDFLETGDDLIDRANVGADAAALYAQYADRAATMAQLWDSKRKDWLTEAQGWLGAAQAFIAEARGRAEDVAQRINTAAGYQASAQARTALGQSYTNNAMSYINAAQGRFNEVQSFIGEASARALKLQRYLEEMAQRVSQIGAYINEAGTYLAASQAETAAADRFLADARERHVDYWSVLRDRVQSARRKSMTALKQFSFGQTVLTYPTGSET